MADTLERKSPLQPWAARFALLPNSVATVEEPFVTMVDLRLDPSAPGAATAASCSVSNCRPPRPPARKMLITR
jgi:sarcosine oxidase subunit gamma